MAAGRPGAVPVAWLIGALLVGAAPAAAQVPGTAVPGVRPLRRRAAEAIEDGMERSATFRALVDALERSDVRVYIDVTPYLSGRVSGGLSFVGASASMRFVRIALDARLTPWQTVYVLAHELQHALEVARAPDVRTLQAFDDLYRHIGFAGAVPHSFDSIEARATGEQVRRELAVPRAPR